MLEHEHPFLFWKQTNCDVLLDASVDGTPTTQGPSNAPSGVVTLVFST